jgi:hypothetical protein
MSGGNAALIQASTVPEEKSSNGIGIALVLLIIGWGGWKMLEGCRMQIAAEYLKHENNSNRRMVKPRIQQCKPEDKNKHFVSRY